MARFTQFALFEGSVFDQPFTAAVDPILGDDGPNLIEGTDGDDLINGLAGDDVINGLAGNDTIFGDAGDDTLIGGAGADLLVGGGGTDTIDGGAGFDTVSFEDLLVPVFIDLSAGAAFFFVEVPELELTDTFINIEAAVGTAFDDVIVGSYEQDTVFGGAGDDVIEGAAAADLLNGGFGDDVLSGGDAFDFLFGGFGNDFIEGGNGVDTINGGVDNDVLFGDAGADLINGNIGDDFIFGGDGFDALFGGFGDDVIVSGLGQDLVGGGVGADLITGNIAQHQGDTINGFSTEDTLEIVGATIAPDDGSGINATEFDAETGLFTADFDRDGVIDLSLIVNVDVPEDAGGVDLVGVNTEDGVEVSLIFALPGGGVVADDLVDASLAG
ncbi:MAG: calcium-binding protein [Maricaulaceae bacterium]